MGRPWIIRGNQCGHYYACRLVEGKVLLEYAHPDKVRPSIVDEVGYPGGLFKTKEGAAQAAWDLDLEFKEMTRFKATKLADKSFDGWGAVGTKVEIKSGKFAGHTGIIRHQTTIHRVNMMIFIPELDIDTLCARGELRILK